MRLIDEQNAEAYLRETSRVDADEPIRVRALAGGVSNMVLLVERPARGDAFVLKQARAQLRTRQEWFSSVERNWREADVLVVCSELLRRPPRSPAENLRAHTPEILFQDRENYLFAMSAAPEPNVVWKQSLLAGDVDPGIAAACGELLGTLHAESWSDQHIARRLGDRTLFDELRIDPYYRTLARERGETRGWIERLIASQTPLALVHADFSPKNLLVFAGGLLMVDFETGHYGDPAFDLGFFLSHLLLKACLKAPGYEPYLALSEAFRHAYDERLAARVGPGELDALWVRGVQHFAGCAWARLDGKSPVDYLAEDTRRETMRALCREVFAGQPRTWDDALVLARQRFRVL